MTLARLAPFALLVLALVPACKASDADCDALGDHFAEISAKEAEAQGIPADFVKGVAEEGKKELVTKCKAEKPSKKEVDCLMKAQSFDEFKACGG